MPEKKRLGRGLGALIPEVMDEGAETNEITLDLVKPNPYQPRRDFDDEKLKELTASIKEHGVLQAVVVSPDEDGKSYTLVAGERRCRAAKQAGLKSIPAIVKPVDRKTMLEIALIENLQREDLNPIDEAMAYKRLMQEYNYTQEELARRLGRSRPSIANSVRLLGLPDKIQDMLAKNEMSPGQVRPLLTIGDQDKQEEAARLIVEEGLSARDAERMVAKLSRAREKKAEEGKPGKASSDPLQEELQLQMQRALGTKVKIKPGKKGGSIEIFYYGDEDLERVISKLLPGGL